MALLDRLKQLLHPEENGSEGREVSERDNIDGKEEASVYGKRLSYAEEDKLQRIALLTPKEHELYLLLLEGYTLKEASTILSVKYPTVNTHMTAMYRKLGVNTRAELIINYRGMT